MDKEKVLCFGDSVNPRGTPGGTFEHLGGVHPAGFLGDQAYGLVAGDASGGRDHDGEKAGFLRGGAGVCLTNHAIAAFFALLDYASKSFGRRPGLICPSGMKKRPQRGRLESTLWGSSGGGIWSGHRGRQRGRKAPFPQLGKVSGVFAIRNPRTGVVMELSAKRARQFHEGLFGLEDYLHCSMEVTSFAEVFVGRETGRLGQNPSYSESGHNDIDVRFVTLVLSGQRGIGTGESGRSADLIHIIIVSSPEADTPGGSVRVERLVVFTSFFHFLISLFEQIAQEAREVENTIVIILRYISGGLTGRFAQIAEFVIRVADGFRAPGDRASRTLSSWNR